MNNGQRILTAVANFYDLEPADLNSRARNIDAKTARFLVAVELRELLNWPFPRIGRFLGYKDHTSAMYAVDRGRSIVNGNPQIQRFLESLKDAVQMDLRKRLESLQVLDF